MLAGRSVLIGKHFGSQPARFESPLLTPLNLLHSPPTTRAERGN